MALATTFLAFDGYETYAVLVTGARSLQDLLPMQQKPDLIVYLGYLIAITLGGWMAGGLVGGFFGDRAGRRRTMLYTVLIYGVFTGLSALATTWWLLAVGRFITGVGIGAQWAVSTSLIQEVWPERYRTRGAGLLQASWAFGGTIAGLAWLLFSSLGISWRFIYLVGVVPAFVAILFARSVPESDRWVKHRLRSVSAVIRALRGPAVRRNLLLGILVSLAITLGWWAGSSYLPTFVGSLVHSGNPQTYTALASILYTVGQVVGCVLFGYLSDIIGRLMTGAVYIAGSLIMTGIVFLLTTSPAVAVGLQLLFGYTAGGAYTWYTVHTPELFPTEVRSTAIGIIFNGARIPAVVGAFVTGALAARLGGVGRAAFIIGLIYIVGLIAIFFLPETKGRPLPE